MKILKNKNLFIIIITIIMIAALIFYGFYTFLGFGKENYDLTKVEYPTSYKELYDLLKSDNSFSKGNFNENNVATDSDSIDYSNTNLQVAGVDEADIVKTDGNYIYALNSEYLYIVKAVDGNMELLSKVKTESNDKDTYKNYIEMYVKDNKLIVLENTNTNTYIDGREIMYDYFWGGNGKVTTLIFDVTDKKSPVKENELSQSGYYMSSRMVDNYLYVITNYYVYSDINVKDESTFVPTLTTDKEEPIAIDDIIIAPNPTSSSYLTVTGIDINNANDFKSSKAVLGSSSNIYADNDSLYIAGYVSEVTENTYSSRTSLIKFSMDKGILDLKATGSVDGYILNQFSMDEYDGYFRIVTTKDTYTYYEDRNTASISEDDNATKNNLYVLDNNLKVVGKIEDLAKEERVYSVRFDNEYAYFVTFKQVDPLFVVDLSNPKDPVIKSQLKIPGFSEYLHVYNDKYLFGLGKEADEEGRVKGIKISMYNITDKTNVTEDYKISVGDEYSWTESSYNHKSILVSSTKGLIAFPVNDYYLVYKFTDGVGFEKIGQINFELSDDSYYYYGNIRGLYINNYLYVINQNQLKTFNLDNLKTGYTLELNK